MKDIKLFDNNNSNNISKEKEDYKKPLHERLAKKHNIKNSTFENFLLENLDKNLRKESLYIQKTNQMKIVILKLIKIVQLEKKRKKAGVNNV